MAAKRCPPAVIEVEGLTKVYGGSHGAKALDGVSFSVPKKGVFGFLGPNGAGKTTTIRILATVLDPTAGTVRIDGHDLRADPLAVKEKLGLMPDEVLFYPTLTGLQHLLYYASFYGMRRADARKRGRDLLEQFGLGGDMEKKVKAYSHGMKKRLALAQCLLHDPEVLIMDEPANGLDPQGIRWLRDLLRSQADAGRTVLISSHVLAEVAQTVDEVVIIHRGKLIRHAAMAEVEAMAAGATTVRSPDATRLASLLIKAGHDVQSIGDGRLAVSAAPEVVGETAAANGVVLHELVTERATLEDVFLQLTASEEAT